MISIDDFRKAELKIGTVKSAERVPGTDRLLRLAVDFGEETPRQILSGIAQYIDPAALVGRQFSFVTNLEPRVIRGLVSNGMLLAVGEGENFALLSPTKTVSSGSYLR